MTMNASHWLEALAGHPVPLLLRQSVEAGLLALVVGLVTFGLRRHLSAAWRHALWAIVFIRLLLPALPVLPAKTATAPSINDEARVVTASPAAPESVLPQSVPDAEAHPYQAGPPASVATTQVVTGDTNPSTPPSRPRFPAVSPWQVAVVLWAFGAASLLGLGLWHSWSLQLSLRRASRPAPPDLEGILCDVGRIHGLKKVPALSVCAAVQVPSLAGWLRPRILLPEGIQDHLSEDRLRFVMGHELAHWRRGDLWWQLGTFLLLAVHWFNPLLWIARHRLREEAEAACDEWLLSRLAQEQARAYGDTLLQLASWTTVKSRAWAPDAPGLLGMAPAVSGLRRRIILLTDWMRGHRGARRAGWAALTLVIAFGFLRAAPPAPAPTPEPVWRSKVKFHVFDDITKVPVAGVTLSLKSGRHEHESTTDDDGMATVVLPGTRPEYASVRARLQGRVPQLLIWNFEQPSFVPPETLDLPMPKAASVGGVVLDGSGKPVPDTKVVLIMRGSSFGASQEIFPDVWERRVSTDEEGRWQFDEAPPGRKSFSLAVEHLEIVPRKFGISGDETAAFYRSEGVTKVERGIKITGAVRDGAGRPVKARLVLGEAGSDSTTYPQYETDDGGRFVMANAPVDDQLIVTAWSKDYAPRVVFWNTASGKPMDIRVDSGKVVRVRVVNAEGSPVAGVMGAADAWHRNDADQRGLRVMSQRFVTDQDGRFTWQHAPAEAVTWDFLGTAQGLRDKREVRIKPGDEEVVVTMLPLLGVTCIVTDADSGQPVPEFTVTPGDRWEFEGWQEAGHRGWLWWRNLALPGKEGRIVYQSDRGAIGRYQRILRLSAPGYMPAISEPLDSATASQTWKVSLKKTPPARIRVTRPDGTSATEARLTWNHVRNGCVRIQHGTFPWLEGPEGDGVYYETDSVGAAMVPPELDEFHLVAAHSSGWGTLRHADIAENMTLQLQPWAGVEIDVSGLAPELRPKMQMMFWDVVLDHPIIDQQTEDQKLTSSSTVFRDDRLVSGLYKLQLAASHMSTTPLAVRLKPGEHRRIVASQLWKWCLPSAALDLPPGTRIDGSSRPKLVQEIDLQGASISDSKRDSLCRLMNAHVVFKKKADGGWEVHLGAFGLGAGVYRVTGVVKGWPPDAAENTPSVELGMLDHQLTIPQSAVGTPSLAFQNSGEKGRLPITFSDLPTYMLPPIKLK